MRVDDLGAGAHTPHDGWCDPNGLLWGFRRKAVELGAVYVAARVTGIGDERFIEAIDTVRAAPRFAPTRAALHDRLCMWFGRQKRRTTLDYQQVQARTGTDKKEGIFYGVW